MAEINGQPRPLCRQHDADALRARERDEQRRDAELESARLLDVREQLKARQASERAARERAEAEAAEEAALAEIDPLTAHLHRLTGAPAAASNQAIPIGDDAALMNVLSRQLGIGSTVALNDDQSLGRIIAGALGTSATFNTSTEHPDQPFDAA